MTIGEVQFRIAHIQSIMTTAAGVRAAAGSAAGVAAGTATTGTAAAGTAAPGTSASQFAAELDRASATADAQHRSAAAHSHDHGAAAAASHQHASAPSGWTSPAHGRVSSEFGPRWGTQHQGLDIAAGKGSTVTAAAGGVVRRASWYGGYGNAVVIDHGSGVATLYGHNSELNVKVGEKVKAGQKIAEVGSTGDSTGPHLHFEVQVNGKRVNPRPWLEKRGIDL